MKKRYGVALSKKTGPVLLMEFLSEETNGGYVAHYQGAIVPTSFRHAMIAELPDLYVRTDNDTIIPMDPLYVGSKEQRRWIKGIKVKLEIPVSIEYFRLDHPAHFVLDDIESVLFFDIEQQDLIKLQQFECDLSFFLQQEIFCGLDDFKKGMSEKFISAMNEVEKFQALCSSSNITSGPNSISVFGKSDGGCREEYEFTISENNTVLDINMEAEVRIIDPAEILALVQVEIYHHLLTEHKSIRLEKQLASLSENMKRAAKELERIDPEAYARFLKSS